MADGPDSGPGGARFRGLAPLRYRDYALYLGGNGVSFVGGQAETVASPWLLYLLTGSPILLGLVGLFHALPIFLFVPLAGTLADRLSPRRLLIVAQCIAVANSSVLGALVVTSLVEPWHIYLQALVSSTVAAFDTTARQALFPRLVPRDQLDQAVNLNFTVSRIAMLSGPTVGGVLLAGVHFAAPYFFNAASFLVMLTAMVAIREPRAAEPAARRRTVGQDLFAGISFMRRSELISAIMVFAALWAILSHNTTLLTVFAADVLEVGPEGLGFLLSAGAAGQLAGSVGLVGYGAVRRKGLLLLAFGGVYTAAMIAFAFSRLYIASAALLLISGIAVAVFSATRHTILQRASPDDMRGRVMGAHLLVTRGLNPVSQTVTGVLVDLLGPPTALLAATIALGAVTAAVAAGSPTLRGYVGEQERVVAN